MFKITLFTTKLATIPVVLGVATLEEILTKLFGLVKYLQFALVFGGIVGFIIGCIMLFRTSKRDAGKDTIFWCGIGVIAGAFVLPIFKGVLGNVLGYPELVSWF